VEFDISSYQCFLHERVKSSACVAVLGDEIKGTAFFPVLFRVLHLLEHLKVQCTKSIVHYLVV